MDKLIQINDSFIVDLNSHLQQAEETDNWNLFEESNVEFNQNGSFSNYVKKEMRECVDFFFHLVQQKNGKYVTKTLEGNPMKRMRIFQCVNNISMKNEEFSPVRTMMLIFLKNSYCEFTNVYVDNLIKEYKKRLSEREIGNFNRFIYSKKDESIQENKSFLKGRTDREELEKKLSENNPLSSKRLENGTLQIQFLEKSVITEARRLDYMSVEEYGMKEEDWIYVRDHILLWIKNSVIIQEGYKNNRLCNHNGSFLENIENNLYESFKKYNSIIEMHKFNVCLFYMDIFYSLFQFDYPYKWPNLMISLFETFPCISIIEKNNFVNVLNDTYFKSMEYLIQLNNQMDLIKASTSFSYSNESNMPSNSPCEITLVLHYDNFFTLNLLLQKMLRKYIPAREDRKNHNYSILYYDYFISHISPNNRNILEIEECSVVPFPCENLFAGYTVMMNMFFPFKNRLLYYFLHQRSNVYALFGARACIKFLYKSLLCPYAYMSDEILKERETLFSNIVNILDMNLETHVNRVYMNESLYKNDFSSNGQTSGKLKRISLSDIIDSGMNGENENTNREKTEESDKVSIMIIMKCKKWALKIINLFLYRCLHFDAMNESWKKFLKKFEEVYIKFLEKVSILILKIMISTQYTAEERLDPARFFAYLQYLMKYTDYLNYSDKCLSLAFNYLCMSVSLDDLRSYVKENVLNPIFLQCLFLHIDSCSTLDCIYHIFSKNEAFMTHNSSSSSGGEDAKNDFYEMESYLLYVSRKSQHMMQIQHDYEEISKHMLKKYTDFIIFLFIELLEKYFFDIIFELSYHVKNRLTECLMFQNKYMHIMFPKMYIRENLDVESKEIILEILDKSETILGVELSLYSSNYQWKTKNYVEESIISIIDQFVPTYEPKDQTKYKILQGSKQDLQVILSFIVERFSLYKYSPEELIYKELYSLENKHKLNYSAIVMNDLHLCKYSTLFLFVTLYKYLFLRRHLHRMISVENLEDSFDDINEIPLEYFITEYKNKQKEMLHYFSDEMEKQKFESIIEDFSVHDKSFFLNYLLVNLCHPYSNNLRRHILWVFGEYVSIAQFEKSVIHFFFITTFINLFFFEKHLKFQALNTLVKLMYTYGRPDQCLYNDFRKILSFLFFHLLFLFIKKEREAIDNIWFEKNCKVELEESNEKIQLLHFIWTGNRMKEETNRILLEPVNFFTNYFINDITMERIHFEIEKMNDITISKFIDFASLYFQNEINWNIDLFIPIFDKAILEFFSFPCSKNSESTFLKSLQFLSFFLEQYKNSSSVHTILIDSILRNQNFLYYFKRIMISRDGNYNDDILNQIYYILYLLTKHSLFDYKIFWYYFLYSLEFYSNQMDLFYSISKNLKQELLPLTPVHIFQFFHNLIRRDCLYFFFTNLNTLPFSDQNFNKTLVQILQKISLCLMILSYENMTDQNFIHNNSLHLTGLFVYSNLVSYALTLLMKNKVMHTYLFWKRINKSYELLNPENDLSDIDECVSNYSFDRYEQESNQVKSLLFYDFPSEHLGKLPNVPPLLLKKRSSNDQFLDSIVDKQKDGNEKRREVDDEIGDRVVEANRRRPEEMNKRKVDLMNQAEVNDQSLQPISQINYSTVHQEKKKKAIEHHILFYNEIKEYFKSRRNPKKKRKTNEPCLHEHKKYIAYMDENEKQIVILLKCVYSNLLFLKNRMEEHVKQLLKGLKYINKKWSVCVNSVQEERSSLLMLQMIHNKRYIYQTFSMYIYYDVIHFFNILESLEKKEENIFWIFDEWMNDIFYVYQGSDDLKYFIFAFSNILIYFCLFEKKKKMSCSQKGDGDQGKEYDVVASTQVVESSSSLNNQGGSVNFQRSNGDHSSEVNSFLSHSDEMNEISNILNELDIDHFSEYVIEQLKDRVRKIINVLIHIILIFPIPMEVNIKRCNKNVLRRLAPLRATSIDIKESSFLSFMNNDADGIHNNGNNDKMQFLKFEELIQNFEFMHLNCYEQKLYERKNNERSFFLNRVIHTKPLNELKLHDKTVSVNYYFKNKMNNDFLNKLVSECNCDYFKIFYYVKKAFTLITQEIYTSEELIAIVGNSDKYFNFVNIIRLDI